MWGALALCTAPVETTGLAAWQIRTGFSCTADLLLRRRMWGRRGVRFLLVVSAEAGPKETRRTNRFPVSGRGQRRISLQIGAGRWVVGRWGLALSDRGTMRMAPFVAKKNLVLDK
jgi:hypothetical protein